MDGVLLSSDADNFLNQTSKFYVGFYPGRWPGQGTSTQALARRPGWSTLATRQKKKVRIQNVRNITNNSQSAQQQISTSWKATDINDFNALEVDRHYRAPSWKSTDIDGRRLGNRLTLMGSHLSYTRVVLRSCANGPNQLGVTCEFGRRSGAGNHRPFSLPYNLWPCEYVEPNHPS